MIHVHVYMYCTIVRQHARREFASTPRTPQTHNLVKSTPSLMTLMRDGSQHANRIRQTYRCAELRAGLSAGANSRGAPRALLDCAAAAADVQAHVNDKSEMRTRRARAEAWVFGWREGSRGGVDDWAQSAPFSCHRRRSGPKRSPSGWSTHSGQVGRGRSSGLGISAMLVSVTAN